MRQRVDVYLPPDLLERYKAEAARAGVSVSATIAHQLDWREKIDDLQEWIGARLNRIEEVLEAGSSKPDPASVKSRGDHILALVGLERLPEETLIGILRDVKEELAGLTAQQREHYAAKGRELLVQMKGGK
jgi:hypothetical protein